MRNIPCRHKDWLTRRFPAGGTEFLTDVIVAPIVDDMLLGLDYLKKKTDCHRSGRFNHLGK